MFVVPQDLDPEEVARKVASMLRQGQRVMAKKNAVAFGQVIAHHPELTDGPVPPIQLQPWPTQHNGPPDTQQLSQ